MKSARGFRSRALIEVARILMQKGWQDSAPDHDRRELIGIVCAVPFCVTSGCCIDRLS